MHGLSPDRLKAPLGDELLAGSPPPGCGYQTRMMGGGRVGCLGWSWLVRRVAVVGSSTGSSCGCGGRRAISPGPAKGVPKLKRRSATRFG